MKYESKLLRNFRAKPVNKFAAWSIVFLSIVLLIQTCSVRIDPSATQQQTNNKSSANLQQLK
jgi:hypothetical protein